MSFFKLNGGTLLVIFLFVFCSLMQAQGYFGKGPVKWENPAVYTVPADAARYDSADIVVLNDITEFFFVTENNEKVQRSITYKINSQKGLNALRFFETPESFDFANDRHLYQQGRRSRIKIPYMKEYAMETFAARRYTNKRWTKINVKDTYQEVRWVAANGEFVKEDMLVFKLNGLMVGDVVEVYYEAAFNGTYGNNVFYFAGNYPKLNCEYKFTYMLNNAFNSRNFVLPVNIPDLNVISSKTFQMEYVYQTKQIKISNVKAINYPVNSAQGANLPHVRADFSFYRSASLLEGEIMKTYLIKAKNLEWLYSTDTTVYNYSKIYDKHHASVKKFLGSMPPAGTDSQNVVFFNALCDTLNKFRFMSANHLFYRESELYNLPAWDHVLKRRLPEEKMNSIYQDVLRGSNLFYYSVNVQDKRLGEHTLKHRAHQGYERPLVALPLGNSYVYFMLRRGGVKYHLNELPFYHEGVLAAITPQNFQPGTKDKEKKLFKIIKTHQSSFNENTRTENALVRINTDSLLAHINTRESLSGQFSTVLRHYYNGDIIDSTIAPQYFKRCVDKPRSSGIRVKPSSHMETFPFRYNFNCSHSVKLENPETLSLHNWFSFVFSKATVPEIPNYDYHFDFEFSDSYNFQLEFTRPVTILNSEQFAKKLNNDYFELESAIEKISEKSYLVKVKLAVKKGSLPLNEARLLPELAAQLDELNGFVIKLK